MTDHQADIPEIANRHGFAPSHFSEAFKALDELISDGLANEDGGRIVITPAGQRYARIAAAAFDAYLARGTARHSLRCERMVAGQHDKRPGRGPGRAMQPFRKIGKIAGVSECRSVGRCRKHAKYGSGPDARP